MSCPPYGWCAPPYIVRDPILDYCYVDEDLPATNFQAQFQLYREYRATGILVGEKRVFLATSGFFTLGSDLFGLLVPPGPPDGPMSAPPGPGNPLVMDVTIFMNGVKIPIPETWIILRAEIMGVPGFDCSTMTWNSAFPLGNFRWMESVISVPAFATDFVQIMWHPAFSGLQAGIMIAGLNNMFGVRLSLDFVCPGAVADNIIVSSQPYPPPNPITQEWAVMTR